MEVKGIEELIEENNNFRIGWILRGAKLAVLRRFIRSKRKNGSIGDRLAKIVSLVNSLEGADLEKVKSLHYAYLGEKYY